MLPSRSSPTASRGSPSAPAAAQGRSCSTPPRPGTGSPLRARKADRMSEQAPRRQREVLDRQRLRSFLLGGAAGIIAGILLAPRSGRELRGSIRERAGEARERSRESLFEAQERMQERLSETREGPNRWPEAEPDDPDRAQRGRRSSGGRWGRPAPASGRTSTGPVTAGGSRLETGPVKPTSFVPTVGEIS